MFRAIKESEMKGREMGFRLKMQEEFTEDFLPGLGKYCEGDECSIQLESGPFEVGFFHTHPGGSIYPSTWDIIGSLARKDKVICTGISGSSDPGDQHTPNVREVNCFAQKKDPNSITTWGDSDMQNVRILQTEAMELSAKIQKIVYELTDKYLEMGVPSDKVYKEALEDAKQYFKDDANHIANQARTYAYPIQCTYRTPNAKKLEDSRDLTRAAPYLWSTR